MRKTILLLFVIMAFLSPAANASWMSTNASFGTSPDCMGKGICSSGTAALLPATWTYDQPSNTMTITFNSNDLAKLQPSQVPNFQGKSYTFDTQWPAPDYINTGLGATNPIVIKAGVPYPISVVAPNITITINLNGK